MPMPWDVRTSPFYDYPEQFLKMDQRVRAIRTVYEDPCHPEIGPEHAFEGELGTVIHVQKGCWPTVRFDRSGTATCVTSFEVEPLS